jgi:hypothetical protein
VFVGIVTLSRHSLFHRVNPVNINADVNQTIERESESNRDKQLL